MPLLVNVRLGPDRDTRQPVDQPTRRWAQFGYGFLRTWRMPIVVLHLAYLWLAAGLALKALALLGGVPFAAYYLHALTIGAATTMIMGVMLVIVFAAALWTAAFILFLWVYGPILLKPRADGKPG
jgi:uncharacterized protein involved in response to NO